MFALRLTKHTAEEAIDTVEYTLCGVDNNPAFMIIFGQITEHKHNYNNYQNPNYESLTEDAHIVSPVYLCYIHYITELVKTFLQINIYRATISSINCHQLITETLDTIIVAMRLAFF